MLEVLVFGKNKELQSIMHISFATSSVALAVFIASSTCVFCSCPQLVKFLSMNLSFRE